MNKTILIVDDSTTMRRMVGDTLREAGFRVLEAIHGQEALEKTRHEKFQLAITDFNMPVMGGVELIRNLRNRNDSKFIPILVLTTEFEDSRKAEAKNAGATGWIVKPFDPERLLQVVNRLLP